MSDTSDMVTNIDRNMPHEFACSSAHSLFTVRAAMMRAAYLLRKEGHGTYDSQQAEVLEGLLIKESM